MEQNKRRHFLRNSGLMIGGLFIAGPVSAYAQNQGRTSNPQTPGMGYPPPGPITPQNGNPQPQPPPAAYQTGYYQTAYYY